MTTRTAIKYRILCTTTGNLESAWVESTDPPLNYCPVDKTHSVNLSSVTEIDRISTTEVKIQEEEKVPTQGIYKFKGYDEAIPSGNVGDVTSIIVSWPRDITMTNGWFYSNPENVGDSIDANVTATVGALIQYAAANSDTFYVTDTVLDNVYNGYYLHLTDLSTKDNLGEIMSIDKANSTVTTAGKTTNPYNPLSPTYVQATGRIIENMKINCPCERYSFAEKKIGGRHLPANVPITINYKNNDGNAKNFTFYIEHLY